MVAYTFERRFADAILDGSKPFTLRKPRRQRHARIGENVTLAWQGRTVSVPCIVRAQLVLEPEGIARVLDLQHTLEGRDLAMLLTGCERAASTALANLPALAERDGFASYEDLYAWHADLAEGESERLIRELIGWDAALLAQAAGAPALTTDA